MADENQVVNYEDNKVSLFAPEAGSKRDIAYVRPGDEIELNFDIRDKESIKVEVTKGDLHIIFANGSTLTLASMAAIGFSENAPRLRTLNGKVLSLEEFLSVTEVLNYNEAVLILANKNQVEYSDSEPKIVQVSSDQDAENDAGIPITGQGNSDQLSVGVPTEVIDPQGITQEVNSSVSQSQFVSTLWTTNTPYNLDKTNYLPGDTTTKNQPSLEVKVLYGSNLSKQGVQNIGGVDYTVYGFENGFKYTDDKTAQITPSVVNYYQADNIYINNSSKDMKYAFNMNYTKGISPSRIEILVPKAVSDFVKLVADSGLDFSTIVDNNDGTLYVITNINPRGIMEFLLSFPEGTQITNFDLTYKIGYLDPSSGEFLTASSTTSLSLYPVTEESHLDKSNGFVLSTHANPITTTTGSGDDVIVGGGGNNIIRSNAGNDKIFTYTGDDLVEAGEGDDQVWGSAGNDLLDGGTGNNTLYYDNKNIGIDPSGNFFKDSYYQTNKSASGLFAYIGFEVPKLKEIAGREFKNYNKITNNSILIKKTQGADVVNNFQTIYLSGYNDTITISDKINLGNILIDGGSVPTGKTDNDTLIIDDDFIGAIVKFADQNTIGSASTTLLTFTNIEQVKGSKNDDTFYGNIMAGFTGKNTAVAIDGGAGTDTLSYDGLTGSIEFNANTGFVQKKDSSGADAGIDKIKNINIIVASNGNDIFYGAFANNYTYQNLSTTDIVSYEQSNSGVTVVFGGVSGLFEVYKTTSYVKQTDIPSSIYKDSLEGDLDTDKNLFLSARNDVIIVNDLSESYKFNAGKGRDILSYAELSEGIEITFDRLEAEVTKGSGGTDTFNIMVDPNNINIYKIIGTNHDDIFNMDDSTTNKSGFYLDGNGGNNTLSYDAMTKDAKGRGVSFTISGGGNSTALRSTLGIVDYFNNFQKFIGSQDDDSVAFSSTVTIVDINGYEFDLGEGTDTVNYNLLSSSESDHIEISFEDNAISGKKDMKITYTKVGSIATTFKNTEGVYGTAGDDIFKAVDGLNLFFDGYQGKDKADYSSVGVDLEFRLDLKNTSNVTKGTYNDTLKNVESVVGGTANNMYFLDSGVSYTIEGNGTKNEVSYYYSLAGISYDLLKNEITKGSGTNQKTDTLDNITSVKGSSRDDIFIVSDNMTSGKYNLYGNDALLDSAGNPTVTPSNDSDKIDFSKLSSALNLILDTQNKGSYNEYDNNNKLVEEGVVSISANAVDFDLYHIESIIGTKQDDIFKIKSSYYGAKGRSQWEIDGGLGEDTVDYSEDTNVGIINKNGSWGLAVDVDLSSAGVRVYRNYSEPNTNIPTRAEDGLTNIEKLFLSGKDDIVTISTGWQSTGIKEVDAGVRTDPKAKGDTLSFAGIRDEIKVDFDALGSFKAEILGSGSGVLPNFINFDNIRLSRGKSTVNFVDGDYRNELTITASSDRNATATLDFSALSSSLTLTLGKDNGEADKLEGSLRGDVKFETTGSRYKIVLSDQANTIFGSSASGKNMDFTGAGTQNTLNYSNVESVGIIIDYAKSTVQKGTNISVYDKFDNSFSTIIGSRSTRGDTFLITDVKINLTGKNINLGSQETDSILINLATGVNYNIFAKKINDDLDISPIQGVNNVNFGNKNDTIKFTADFGSSTNPMDYVFYDGGDGENTLDFSDISRIIYDAKNFKISKDSLTTTPFNSIAWNKGNKSSIDTNGNVVITNEDLIFKRFNIIIGAGTESLFYGNSAGNFDYRGGAGRDTINYSQSLASVQIYLLDNKINKDNNYEDKFNDKIESIVGTRLNDVLIINKNALFTSNVSIDGGGGNDIVRFAFDKNSNTHVEMNFAQAGTTSFTLETGTVKNTVNANFQNFQIYELTENDDKVIRDATLTNNITIRAGEGKDEVIYTGDEDIVFDARTGRVTRGVNFDILNQVEIISYDGGLKTAKFIGNVNSSFTYKGDSKRPTYDLVGYNDAVIDYSKEAPTSSINVDFTLTNSLMTISKASSTTSTDYFDSYITKIIGTKGNDKFILAVRDANFPKIRLEGGGGTDYVSYGNLSSGATFQVDPVTGSIAVVGGSTGFSNYDIDSNTIKAFALTKYNDIFIGGARTAITIDGGDGVDTLDYSALTGVDITVDFTIGKIQKTITAGGATFVDNFSNFESVKTGVGNDRIIIDNKILSSSNSGNFDVGAGRNTLDATAITFNMQVDYGANFVSRISYGGGTSYTYTGFQEIILGKGKNEVKYLHNTSYQTENLIFTSYTGSKDVFNFIGSGNNSFFVDARSNDTWKIDVTLAGTGFMQLNNFHEVSAKGTTYELHIKAAGITGNKIFYGGSRYLDSIDYTDSTYSITASMETDTNNKQYIKISGVNNAFEDHIYEIENITLSNSDDIFIVSEINNYSPGNTTNIIVDANGGSNNQVSLAGLTQGQIFNANSGIITVTGYEFRQFQTMSLTGGNDTVRFSETGNSNFNGNGGTDTADYETNTFRQGVIVGVVNGVNGNHINVNKKGSGDNDELKNFKIFKLTNHADEFIYSGTRDGFGLIHFDMGAGRDTVDFSQLDASVRGTNFLFDGTKLTVTNRNTAGSEIEYSFENMEIVILGGTSSSLTLEALATIGSSGGGVTFNGGDPTLNTNIDLSNLSNGTNINVDLYLESVADTNNTNLGLSFRNFRSVTGSSKVKKYLMTEMDAKSTAVSYTITTNNTNAEISYDNLGIFGGINVNFRSSTPDVTVNKSNGTQDIIKGGFKLLTGTEFSDTFSFTAVWKNGLVIDALGGGSDDTLDLSALQAGTVISTITLNNANYSEISCFASGSLARFRNFTTIRGSTSQTSSVIIDFEGIARDYTGVTYFATSSSSSSLISSFALRGNNIGTNTTGTLSVDANGSSVFATSVNSFAVSVSLEGFKNMNFANVAMDISVFFENYLTTGIGLLAGSKSSKNSLNLSSTGTYIEISGNNPNEFEFKLQNAQGAEIIKTAYFRELILGINRDLVRVTTVTNGLVVDSGGTIASSAKDMLQIGKVTLEMSAVLVGNSVQVYGGATGKGSYSTFINFPDITFNSKGTIYISSSADLYSLNQITDLTDTGVILLVHDVNLVQGSFAGSSILNLQDFSNVTIKLDSINTTKIKGFQTFYLGSGNDNVFYNGKDASPIKYLIHGFSGDNVLTINSWNTTINQAFVEVNKDTMIYHRTSSESGITLKDFYIIDMSNMAMGGGRRVDQKVSVIGLSDNTKYEFKQIEALEFNDSFATAKIDNLIINGSTAILSSTTKGTIIEGTWKKHGANIETNPYIKINNTTKLDYDFTAVVQTMEDSVNRTQADGYSTGVYAPDMETGYKSTLDFRDAIYDNKSTLVHINGTGIYNSVDKGGLMYHNPNTGSNSESIFYNFNYVLFDNFSHRYQIETDGQGLKDGAVYVAGAGTNDEVSNYDVNRFKITNGNQIIDTNNNDTITWQGVEVFTNFRNLFYSISQEKADTSFTEIKAPEVSLSKYNYRRSSENEYVKDFADQITYTLTEDVDTLHISEVKNNTVFDTMEGKDNVILSGNAAFYAVEHFQDKFITVGGKQFQTGGSYLVVTDDDGNKMYILYVNLEDLLAGGVLKYDEEGNLMSSGYQFGKDNYNPDLPISNDRTNHDHDHNCGHDHSHDDHSSNSSGASKSSSSAGNNGAMSYGRGFSPSFYNSEENTSFSYNGDSSFNFDKGEEIEGLSNATDLSFELIEDEGLELAFDDEINLEQDDASEESSDDVVDSNDNEAIEEDIPEDLVDNYASGNQNISDEELLDMIAQTFSKEDDSLDNLDISLNLGSNTIDMSSINVEETVLQESDIDSYKLESERNDDGILKIHNQNGSNGNGGLGSF